MNMEYRNLYLGDKPGLPPPAFPSKPISGKSLAHIKLTALRSAAVAAQIKVGERPLVDHTIEQVALLTRANRVMVSRMLRLTRQERQLIADGIIQKMPPIPVPKKKNWQLQLPFETAHQNLLSTWNAASPAERVAFARAIGVERFWNRRIGK